MIVLTLFAMILALGTLPGTLELLFLTIGSLIPIRRRQLQKEEQQLHGRLVVIVPAHNEENTLPVALESLKKNRGQFDIVVVADNCTDGTEKVAFGYGVRVLVRKDQGNKGKNYALSFAFQRLLKEGYAWFAIVDADTLVKENFIKEIKHAFAHGVEAVQTRYGVLNPVDTFRTRLMNIAFLAFNYLRPRGRCRWGLSAGILGNGFALSRKALEDVPYHNVESIVEDLAYHLRLITEKFWVDFLETTGVLGEMPVSEKGVAIQRGRWEGGRFAEVISSAPVLMRGVLKGRFDLIEPLLELLLLPLAYHVLLLSILLVLPITFIQVYAFFSLGVVAFHLLTALVIGGGGIKDAFALLFVPYYIVWKLGVLFRIMISSKKRSDWVRTERVSTEKSSGIHLGSFACDNNPQQCKTTFGEKQHKFPKENHD